jgi:hypothetical protein
MRWRKNMLIRTGLWSLEDSKSWLLNYEWGAAIAGTIEDHPEPRRRVAWICMVMDMEAVLTGAGAVRPAAGKLDCQDRSEDADVRPVVPVALLE